MRGEEYEKKDCRIFLALTVLSACFIPALAFEGKTLEETQSNVNAYVCQEDGTKIPVNCDVTITEMPATARSLEGTTYLIAVRTAQKTISSSNDINKDGVVASAYIEMLWTDRTGFSNSIDHLTGNVNITKGTFKSAKLCWGHTHATEPNRTDVGTTFDCDINFGGSETQNTPSLHACYTVSFSETRSTLYVKVDPTIFD